MIKSIIFDWGGVLIDNPQEELINHCARYLNVSKEKFNNVLNALPKDVQNKIIENLITLNKKLKFKLRLE